MDRFRQMQVFTAVAEEQGFAAAARRLRMSPPAVTRDVSALEESLGVKLLDRTTRYMRITDAGLGYLEDCRRILADVAAAESAALGINAEPKGHIKITAPMLFGRLFVMPVVLDYLNQYPDMEADLILLDRVVNLVEEGLDIGVRIGELPDSTMRALKVGTVRKVVVASPDYLRRAGRPQIPTDLTNHSVIASQVASYSPTASDYWRFHHGEQEIPIHLRPRLNLTTNDSAIEAASCGFGITRILSYQVAPYLADGRLEVLLEPYEPPPHPIHIVHREGRYSSAKVRTFIDLLAERLRGDQSLQQNRE